MTYNEKLDPDQACALGEYEPLHGWPPSMPWPLSKKTLALAKAQRGARRNGLQKRYESALAESRNAKGGADG
jgi:hypothetical protein